MISNREFYRDKLLIKCENRRTFQNARSQEIYNKNLIQEAWEDVTHHNLGKSNKSKKKKGSTKEE